MTAPATILRTVRLAGHGPRGGSYVMTNYCPVCGWESEPVRSITEARRKARHERQGAAAGAFALTEPVGRATCR